MNGTLFAGPGTYIGPFLKVKSQRLMIIVKNRGLIHMRGTTGIVRVLSELSDTWIRVTIFVLSMVGFPLCGGRGGSNPILANRCRILRIGYSKTPTVHTYRPCHLNECAPLTVVRAPKKDEKTEHERESGEGGGGGGPPSPYRRHGELVPGAQPRAEALRKSWRK